jgi:hypothetical protein
MRTIRIDSSLANIRIKVPMVPNTLALYCKELITAVKFGATTISIMTLSKMTLSIMGLFATLSVTTLCIG